MLVLPDHPTPVALRTHTIDPVPYILCTSADVQAATGTDVSYSEKNAHASGNKYPIGHKLLAELLQKTD